MAGLLFYYLFLPFLIGWAVIKFIKKYGRQAPPADLQRMLLNEPIARRCYRAVRRDDSGLNSLGDFEKHEEAVDRIYAGREEARSKGARAAFLVLNDAGETLDLIDC